MKLRRSNQIPRGITLIQIIVVIAILALIASAVVINLVHKSKEAAQRQTAMLDIKGIESALNMHRIQKGTYPDPAKGLVALQLKNTRDPWGHDYVYRLEGGKPVVLSDGTGGAPIVGCPDGCPAGYTATESREEAK